MEYEIMKKALTLLVLITTPMMAMAQGTVTLGNQTGLIRQWTNASDSTLISVPKSGGYVQLIAAPVGTALPHPLGTLGANGFVPNSYFTNVTLATFLAANPGWAAAIGPNSGTTANAALIAAMAGIVNGGTYTINNIGAGANADYFWFGWTGSFTTLDAALAAGTSMFGESAIATTATASPLSFSSWNAGQPAHDICWYDAGAGLFQAGRNFRAWQPDAYVG